MQHLHADGFGRLDETLPVTSGSSNIVHGVEGRPGLVLRRSKEETTASRACLDEELALTNIMHHLGVHPGLVAARVWPSETSPTNGTAASLQVRGVSLDEWLRVREAGLHAKSEGAAAASSLLKKLCLVSDAGYCLADVKPKNAVILGNDVRLIDFDCIFSIFMDPVLVKAFMVMAARDSRDAACARTRGFSLYLMALLFYLHVHKLSLEGGGAPISARTDGFLRVLWGMLSSSCVPLDVLTHLGRQKSPSDLAWALPAVVQAYFFPDEDDFEQVLRRLTRRIRKEGLRAVGCGAAPWDVHVMGVTYSRDDASCGGERRFVVGASNGREYPCAEAIRHGGGLLRVQGNRAFREEAGHLAPLEAKRLRRERSRSRSPKYTRAIGVVFPADASARRR